jgi:hypothetical protein
MIRNIAEKTKILKSALRGLHPLYSKSDQVSSILNYIIYGLNNNSDIKYFIKETGTVNGAC